MEDLLCSRLWTKPVDITESQRVMTIIFWCVQMEVGGTNVNQIFTSECKVLIVASDMCFKIIINSRNTTQSSQGSL